MGFEVAKWRFKVKTGSSYGFTGLKTTRNSGRFLNHDVVFGADAEDNLVIKKGLTEKYFFVIPNLIRDPDTRSD